MGKRRQHNLYSNISSVNLCSTVIKSPFLEQINDRGGISLHGENVSVTLSYVEDYSSHEYVISAMQFLLSGGGGLLQPADFFLAPYSRSTHRCNMCNDVFCTQYTCSFSTNLCLMINVHVAL